MRNKIFLIVGTLLLFNVFAHAENEISIYSGYQTLPHANLNGTAYGDPINKTIGWEGKSFSSPPYYGLKYVNWDHNIGYGIEFTHAKAYAPVSEMPANFSRLELTDGLNLITANAYKRWDGNLYNPFIIAGLGVSVPHVDITYTKDGTTHKTYEYQFAGGAIRLGGGISYPINSDYSIFSEYQFTYSMNELDLVNDGGTLSVNLVTNAINFGVSRKF